MKKFCSLLLATAVVLSIGTAGFADNLFCRNCGKSIPADSRFCSYCGTKVIIGTDNSGNVPSDNASGLIISERNRCITVGNGKYDIWICDTDTNLITGHPAFEQYDPSYLRCEEVYMYLFQCCLPSAATDIDLRTSIGESGSALCEWFEKKLGGENRFFSCALDEGGFILILHSDNALTPEQYPFYGPAYISDAFGETQLCWMGPFNSASDAREQTRDCAAAYPVETENGEVYSLTVYCELEDEWLERE